MFKIENWGSDTSNIKNSLGGPAYFRYYNQENNDVTTAGYFPDNLRLKKGDRIVVIPQDTDAVDELYVVTEVNNGTPTVAKATGGGGNVESVNGKTGEVVLDASDVDALPNTTTAEDIGGIPQFETMPAASAEYENKPVQYIGATDANYTNGYFYKAGQGYAEGITTEVTKGEGSSLSITSTNVEAYKSAFPGIQEGDVKTFVYKRSTAGAAGAAATDAVGSFSVSLTLSDLKTFWQANIDPYINQYLRWKTSGVNFATFEYVGNDNWNLLSPYPEPAVVISTADFASAGITITGSPQSGDHLWLTGSEGSHWEVSNYYNLCTTVVSNSYGTIGIKYTGQPLFGDEITATYSTHVPSGYAWVEKQVQSLDLTGVTGYDATKTQTLKNVQGVLTWVDDA